MMSIDVHLEKPSLLADFINRAIQFIEEGCPQQAVNLLRGFMEKEAESDEDDAVDMTVEVYGDNITANVFPMWEKANIDKLIYSYEPLLAQDMIGPLEDGLEVMLADREGFEELNPSNGWGSYDGAVRFLKRLIAACREHPDAVYRGY